MTPKKNPVVLADWVRTHSAIGAMCGNCGTPFTLAKTAKGVVGVPNGAGYSIYVLCTPVPVDSSVMGPLAFRML